MDTNILAYIAGVIDSDGTIGIKRSTYSMRVTGDSKAPGFSERVCVKQVEPHAVDLIHQHFGGTRYVGKPSAKKGRALFVWQVTDRKAADFLRAIAPYLRIKRQQADNCIALREVKEQSKRARVAPGRGHAGSAPRPAALGLLMQELCDRAHELNRVGVA